MLRSVGSSIAACALVAGCSFQATPPPATGSDGSIDAARIDAARIDAALDAPIDAGPKKRKKRFAVDRRKVPKDIAGFPVWVALTDADLKARALPSGADIHFTKVDGADLPYELQRWDASTGRLEAWVRVDLDRDADTPFELRYGDPAGVRPPTSTEVFSTADGFAAVWHLDDSLAGQTPKVDDATANLRDGMPINLAPSAQVTGKLGGGIEFDGTDDRIQFANPYTGNGQHTISAWVNQGTVSGHDTIVTVGNPNRNQSRWFHSHYTQNVGVGFFQNDWPDVGRNIDSAGWVLVHWVFEGNNRRSRFFINGDSAGQRDHDPGINTQGTMGFLGYAPEQWGPGASEPCQLKGVLDEVRLSTVARDSDWIKVEYANQSEPETFYSVGPEQLVE